MTGTEPIELPQEEPDPRPVHKISESGNSLNRCTEWNMSLAPITDVPTTPAASSNKSGRPTSPTNTKSPVKIPIGSVAPPPRSEERRVGKESRSRWSTGKSSEVDE